MKKRLVWVLIAVVAVVAVAFLYAGYRRRAALRSVLSQLEQSVFTAVTERRDLEVIVSGKGNIQPDRKKTVTPGVSGKVLRVAAEEGQLVAAGDLLVMLSSDSVRYQAEQSCLDLDQANQALKSLTGPSGVKARSEVEVRQAETNLAGMEDKIAALTATSPIDGQLWALEVNEGDPVKAGQILATVAHVKSLKVSVRIKQVDVSKVKTERPVSVFPGGDLLPQQGTLTFVGKEGIPGSKGTEFPAEITVEEPHEGLLPGMTVTVTYNAPDGTFLSWSGTAEPKDKREVRAGADGTVEGIFVSKGTEVTTGQEIMCMSNPSLFVSYDQAVNALESARQSLNSCDGQIEQQRLKVAQAALNLREKEEILAKLAVRSPIPGKVISISVSPGDDVSPNQTVAEVSCVDPLIVSIPVDELDIASVAPGQEARVEVDAFPGHAFMGQVQKVAQEGQVKQGITNYAVTVALSGSFGARSATTGSGSSESGAPDISRLRFGMSATVTVAVAKRENVLSIPVEAVRWDKGQAYVNRIEEGEAVQKKIKVGVQNDMYAEVMSGLEEGDAVLIGDLPNMNLFRGLRLPTQIPGMRLPR